MKPDINDNLGQLKRGLLDLKNGRYPSAIKRFQNVIGYDPNNADAFYWLGVVYLRQHLDGKATACFSKAVALNPDCIAALYHLGLSYLQEGKLVLSRDAFCRVTDRNSDDWRAWANLCVVQRELGDLSGAEHSGLRAVALNRKSYAVWHNLGNVYKDMERYHQSIECYQQSLALNPRNGDTHVGMGIACQGIGDTEKAIHCFREALIHNPQSGVAVANLVHLYMMECSWDQVNFYGRLLDGMTKRALTAGQVPAETPFLNLSRHDDPELNFAVARAWGNDIVRKMADTKRVLKLDYSKGQRQHIRIGYLSNNFCDHPTAHITRKLYRLHDRKQFEIFCFSFGPEDNSRYRDAIRKGCDQFIDIRGMSHASAAQVINDYRVDILVDLVGFMKGERSAIAALRPAPVQVRWLGMAGTSGGDFFDYLITDSTVTPENQAPFYREKFCYLPHCYQINDNQPFMDENGCRRSDYGLPEGAFVFCCFNTSYKIDAAIFAAWMNILRRLPGSVLWLMGNSEHLNGNLRKRAYEAGINANRLIFAEKVAKHRHLSRLSLADLGLDSRLVNGAASTSDALWAGVPVLSIKGNHFASRMGCSILKTAGLGNWVAEDLAEYEAYALRLAVEPGLLFGLKRQLKTHTDKLPLFDTPLFVKQLERAYQLIWRRHLEGKAPEHIYVDKTVSSIHNNLRRKKKCGKEDGVFIRCHR